MAALRRPVFAAQPLEGAARLVAMTLFGIIVALSAVVFGAMAVHLVPVLEATGLTAATAVFLASLKGFAQVGGRIWDLVFARNWHALDVGRVFRSRSCRFRSWC